MINFTKTEYKQLIKNGIKSNEGTLFKNPSDPSKIIKTILEIKDVPEYLPLKIYTIQMLLKNREILSILPLAYPDDIVCVEYKERGFQTNNIEGILLEDIIYNPRISLKFKIKCFKQIGSLLRKMAEIRQKTPLKNFFYNDIHEGNFIVNTSGIVYGIDPDSFSIEDNIPSSSYYSEELVDLIPYGCKKYQAAERICIYSTEIVPSENLDMYCYIRMILNMLYGQEIDFLNRDKLLDYLDFLEYYGGDIELLDVLARIHDYTVDNINPDYLLDKIQGIYEYANINHDKSGNLRKVLR